MSDLLTVIETLLAPHPIKIAADGTSFTHVRTKRSALMDVLTLTTRLSDRAWVASYLEGVAAGLGAPSQELAPTTFADAAGILCVRIEGPGFHAGLRHTDYPDVFCESLFHNLDAVYWLELDQGPFPLPAALVESWGVTRDRVTCGARSLLFHKTREATARSEDGVEFYGVGDGYDCARALVIEDVLWDRSQKGLVVAIPCDGKLLFAAPNDTDAVRKLTEQAGSLFAESPYPIFAEPFHIRGRKLVAAG